MNSQITPTRIPSIAGFHCSPPSWLTVLAALLCLCAGSARASIFSQSVIDSAVALPLHAFVNTPGNELQNVPMEPCMAINFMAHVVHQDPAATTTGGTLVRDRLVAQL